MNKKIAVSFLSIGLFVPTIAKAHCPLCTAGAGALAVGAAYLGVSTIIVGMFIGAFALALSLWIERIVKKQYIKYQKQIIITLVFLSTIIPIMPLITEYQSFNLYLFGEYGSLLNRTYMYNKFIVGVIVGTLIMYASPYLSMYIKEKRNGKLIPYQGIIITFSLLVLFSLIVQLTL
ncbi:MAG: hypothetical protein L3J07_01790 [Candidatus Magasanikbacteria bacterium]|nr:hypothetical protein [Candidatus Magasanikbacteria bacterium]